MLTKTSSVSFFSLSQVIAPAALFLAAKVEEQPRKLEHVIKVAHACLNPQETPLDSRSDVSIGVESYESIMAGMFGTFSLWLMYKWESFTSRLGMY